MATTIGDLINGNLKLNVPKNVSSKMNGTDVPATVLRRGYDELVGHIVLINQYVPEGIEVPREDGLGRMISISPQGICKFDRKNGSTFKIHIDDIKKMRLFTHRAQN